jgi:hypothetical protein
MNVTAGNMAAIPNTASFVCDAWENRGTMVFVLEVLSILGFSIAFLLLQPASINTEIVEIERSRRCGGGAEKDRTSIGERLRDSGSVERGLG